MPAKGLSVGVETEENSLVDKGVLLLSVWSLLDLLASGADNRLDFVAVDQASDVGVGDLGRGQNVVLLVGGNLVKGAEDFIKKTKGGLSPDNEAADVTTRGQLKEVEPAHVDEFNTGKIAESLHDALILAINNERAASLTVAAVAELSLSSTELARVGDLDDIRVSLEGLEEGDSLLCLGEGFNGRLDNKRNLLNLLDAVAAGENKGGKGRSSEGRHNSETALVLVNFDVPLAPGFGRGEHTTTTAHVTEGSLARIKR